MKLYGLKDAERGWLCLISHFLPARLPALSVRFLLLITTCQKPFRPPSFDFVLLKTKVDISGRLTYYVGGSRWTSTYARKEKHCWQAYTNALGGRTAHLPLMINPPFPPNIIMANHSLLVESCICLSVIHINA